LEIAVSSSVLSSLLGVDVTGRSYPDVYILGLVMGNAEDPLVS
jgi:hypothetical protein